MSLGKAVPPGQEVPSLIYQLAQASNQKHVDFSSIVSGAGAPRGSLDPRAPRDAAAALAGFTQMPFTFVFNGSFTDLYHLFQQLNRFTVRTASGGLQVSGRLLTIQSTKARRQRRRRQPGKGSAEQLTGHDHGDRLRAPGRPGADRRSDAPRLRRAAPDLRPAWPAGHRAPRRDPRDREGDPMTDFLGSLKADLLDRRMLPLLALVGVALVGALAYAVLGGGSSSTSPTATTSAPPISLGAPGIAISQAPSSASQAIAETTSGSARQRGGSSRDPFTPLPRITAKSAAAT